MDILWAPWRSGYIGAPPPERCVFCLEPGRSHDEENLVLARTRFSFVMMNRYPYINGHLLAIPLRHTAEPDDLLPDELLDLFEAVRLCRKVLMEEMSPHGFNIGMNLGRVAGAGVEDHLHMHVLPRWQGDANFMTSVAGVRVLPEDLQETYRKLRPRFDRALEVSDGG